MPFQGYYPGEKNKPDIELDVEYFEACGLCFVNKEDAQSVCDLVNSLQRLNIGYDFQNDYTYYANGPEETGVHVTPKRVSSQSQLDETKAARAKFKSLESEYKKAKAEYDDIASRRATHADEIYNTISDARQSLSTKNNFKLKIERYLELSARDCDVALKFFEDAHPDVLAEYPELRGCFGLPETEAA